MSMPKLFDKKGANSDAEGIQPVFVIAEAGVNHNGCIATALDLIDQASKAGADCVKFQTFRAESVVTANAPKAKYQTRVADPRESQLDMLRGLELAASAYPELINACKKSGMVFTSTPYNEEDIAFLDSLDIPIFKAASIHIVEPHFLKLMAQTGRPILVSTGMATWEEIDKAVRTIRSTGNNNFVLLQCTTNYPSEICDVNLNAMIAMRERYDCLVGYSDHTQSHIPSIGAVALGACVIEKHFTLDRTASGPDHSTSETPAEFKKLVESIRTMEMVLGQSEKKPTLAEQENMPGMRRSIVAKRDISLGKTIEDDDLICKRPATGISPSDWEHIVGKVASRKITAGAILQWEDLNG